jgi:hypothetical protein
MASSTTDPGPAGGVAPPPARPLGAAGPGPDAPFAVAVRPAGVLGIAGGVVLLAAFVISIEQGANTIRLLVFAAGLAATAAALWTVHAPVQPRLATVGSVPVITATGAFVAWLLGARGVDRPFAGDFGLLGFWVAIAMWLAAAWLGVVAIRLRVAPRVASWLLAGGSLLAITGIDRLELRARLGASLIDAVSLAGLAMVGLGLVLLGWFLVRRRA